MDGRLKYDGQFAAGLYSGEGTKYLEDKNGEIVVTGIWKENKLVEKNRHIL